MYSFANNLIASQNGCNRPTIPILFGPFRICIYLNSFCSKRDKKEIPIIIKIIIKIKNIKLIKYIFKFAV